MEKRIDAREEAGAHGAEVFTDKEDVAAALNATLGRWVATLWGRWCQGSSMSQPEAPPENAKANEQGGVTQREVVAAPLSNSLESRWRIDLADLIAMVAALLALWGTYLVVSANREAAVLGNRAYVSVDMPEARRYEIRRRDGSLEDVGYGGDVVLSNFGKTPAANIRTHYYITTDKDLKNHEGREWFREALGDFPSISFLAPNSSGREIGGRSLSPSATYYYFEALTTYEGLGNRRHWTHIRKVFAINGIQFLTIRAFGDWDRNERPVPQLSSLEEVRGVMDELNNNRIGAR